MLPLQGLAQLHDVAVLRVKARVSTKARFYLDDGKSATEEAVGGGPFLRWMTTTTFGILFDWSFWTSTPP
jgi:hypothetical protein